MDPWWHRTLVRELSRPLSAMADNLDYVLREQKSLSLPADLRQRVVEVCGSFREALASEVADLVREMEETEARGRGEEPAAEGRRIGTRVGQLVESLDELVRELRRASASEPDLGLVEILATESATNVLNAYKELKDRLEYLAGHPPDRTEESHVLDCSVCGRPAVSFDVAADQSTGQRGLRFQGIARGEWLPPGDDVLEALRGGDLATVHARIPEGIDAYCPQCARIYCRDHYRIEEEWDEGFYDCTRATCPAGHRRMIDD